MESKLKLEEIIKSPNLATELDDCDLSEIAEKVIKGYDDDLNSRSEWCQTADKILKLVKLTIEPKSFPWNNASNIKYPITSTAVIQFAARTYPEVVQNGKVVGCAVIGRDMDGEKAQQAERVSQFMSYQLLIESTNWEEHMDRLLHVYPVIGVAFKKTYYDPIKRINQSILCMHDEIVVNDHIPSLEDALRISHILKQSSNTLLENMRAGLYKNIDFEELKAMLVGDEELHELIEQHRFLDLDGDDYEEPYIVTVHKSTKKVLRIVARFDPDGVTKNEEDEVVRIKPVHYFTDFHAIPSPDGKYHSFGIGTLLLHPNEAINSLLNQLVDSGTLANLQGGFIGNKVEIQGGMTPFQLGEWKRAKVLDGSALKDQVVPVSYKEPSDVLYKLLEFLTVAAEKLSSVTDVMTGNADLTNVKTGAATMANDNSRMVFSSMQRRLYRSLKSEFEKWFRLNSIYLDELQYFSIMGDTKAISRNDFNPKSLSIKPVSDPNLSSSNQRVQQAEGLMKLSDMPNIQLDELVKRYLEAHQVPNPEKLMRPADPPPPNPEMAKLQADQQKSQVQAQLQAQTLGIQKQQADQSAEVDKARIALIRAQAMYQLAQAESIKADIGIEYSKLELNKLDSQANLLHAGAEHQFQVQKIRSEHELRNKEIDQRGRDAKANNSGLDEPSSDESIL